MPRWRAWKQSRDEKAQPNQRQAHLDHSPIAPGSAMSSKSSKSQSQPVYLSPPQDPWQCAFKQLDQKDQDVLRSNHHAASNKEDENYLRPKDVTKQVIDVINTTKKTYEKEQEQGGIKIKRSNREDVDIRKVAGKILNAAFSFQEVICKGVACDPTGHAASVWAVVSLGMTMAKNHSDRRNALFGSAEYLAEVLARCVYIEENFLHHQSSDYQMIQSALIKVYKEILQYTAKVMAAHDLGKVQGLLDSITGITNQGLTDSQSSVEEAVQNLHEYIALDKQLQNGAKAEEILATIDKNVLSSLHDLTLRFGLPIAEQASFDSFGDQHEDYCLESTRVDLRCQILEWANSSESKKVFWLNGMAGTGKSTIARTVARSFQENGQLGASFFFKKGEVDRSDAKRLIPTITRQLMAHNLQLAQRVLEAVQDEPDIATKALRQQFERLICQPLQSPTLGQNAVMVIVIDALDECEKTDEIRAILQLLPEIPESAIFRLKIFLTSRPEPLIYRQLGQNYDNKCLVESFVLEEVSVSVVDRDIRIFLKDRLSRIRTEESSITSHCRPQSLDWPSPDKIDELARMSVPLFIYAATLCRFIGDGNRPTEVRLEAILQLQEFSPAFHMEGIYQPVLNQILNPSDKDESMQLADEFCEIVGSIVLLATPLSIHSLGKLLNRREENIRFLLNKLRSVLRVPEDLQAPVRILHLSFREFLIRTSDSFHVDAQATHSAITSRCLLVMGEKLKRNMCNLESYGYERSEIDSQVIELFLPVELQYACKYWAYHREQSGAHISDTELLRFLKKSFLYWLEAMSLMGVVSDTVGIIDGMWSDQQNNGPSELSEFLYDAKRFVLKNLQMIENAPLQIYVTALAFAPTQSIIRRQFEMERYEKIRIMVEAQQTWGAELQTLESHSHSVNSVVFSPDGETLASGSSDQTVKLWDSRTGRELQTLRADPDWVTSLAFSPDGQVLASASLETKPWDAQTGKELRMPDPYSKNWTSLAFPPACDSRPSLAFSPVSQILALGSFNGGTIMVLDSKTGKERQTLESHSYSVQCLAFSPDGQILASGGTDEIIKLWDPKTGKDLQTLKGHSSSITSIAFSRDGQILASGSRDKTVKIWETVTGKELHTFQGHSEAVMSVAFHPSKDRILASGGIDQTIKLWDPRTGKELQTLKGHADIILSIAFSPNGQTIASGSANGTIKLWDAKIDQQFRTTKHRPIWTRPLEFSPDVQVLASQPTDQTVRLCDAITGKELQVIRGYSRIISRAFTQDGQTLAIGSTDGTITLWDLKASTRLHIIRGHSASVRYLAFSPYIQVLASVSDDKTIKLWNFRAGKVLHTLTGHSDQVISTAFSQDGQILASGTTGFTIKIWDITTGKEIQTLKSRSNFIASLALSQDGQILALGPSAGSFELWNSRTGEQLRIIPHFSLNIRSISLSPDGQILVSQSLEEVRYWNAETGKELQTLEGHPALVGLIARQSLYNPSSQFSIRNGWVAVGSEKLVRLPVEYRKFGCSARKDGYLALGYPGGNTLTFCL